MIFNKDIRPVEPHEIADSQQFASFFGAGKKALAHAVMIVLNGGLGTSMGLTSAKSLLEARNGKTFLEIIVRQAEIRKIQLAFMNSFNTHADTLAALNRLNPVPFPLRCTGSITEPGDQICLYCQFRQSGRYPG